MGRAAPTPRDRTRPASGPGGTGSRLRRGAAASLAAAVLAVVAGAAPAGASAQQEGEGGDETLAVRTALERNRHALTMEDGRLTGPGADFLLREAAAARHLLVGETHGVAEAPALVADLFRRLRDDGYRHLAVEIGPVQARRLNQVLSGSDPMAGLRAFLGDHWPGVPFYSWREEAELLAAAVEAAGGDRASGRAAAAAEGGEGRPRGEVGAGAGPMVLWGLDYDVLGDRWPLHRLREIAPDAGARAAADRAVALADSLLRRATEAGDPSGVMMFSGPDSVWRALREAYDPAQDSEADLILEQLEATARINEAWTSGRRLASNRLRVELIKRNFHRHADRAAPGAKVLVKMGAFHTMRGRTPNGTWDIGNHLQELAAAGGEATFHVAVLGGPDGRKGTLDPRDWGVREVPTVMAGGDWAKPLAAALLEEGWTVFDLRPLRRLSSAGRLEDLPSRVERIVWGHDALVVIRNSTAASPVEVDRGR